MTITKYIKRQDSGWKQQFGYSGETSINLSQEIADFLSFGLVSEGEEMPVTFVIYKKDFVLALEFIQMQCPLFRTTSRTCLSINSDNLLFSQINRTLESFFGNADSAEYTVTLYRRRDGRIYLKHLKHDGFTVRDYLVENSSAIIFGEEDGVFSMHISSAVAMLCE